MINRPMIFCAPEGAIEAPGVTVPVIAPATTEKHIEPVDLGESAADVVYGVKGPEEILGESPEEALKKATDGELPKTEVPKTKTKEPKAKVPKATPKTPAKPGEPPTTTEVDQPPTKLKIGEEEKTVEDWQKELKELREKTTSKAAPDPSPNTDPDDKEVAAQKEASQKQLAERRKAWIDEQVARKDDPIADDKVFDTMLAGGPEAVKLFKQVRAHDKAELREFVADAINHVLGERDSALRPIMEREKTITQYNEEHRALNATPELKTHAKGLETYRKVRDEYQAAFEGIQAKRRENKATQAELQWSDQFSQMKPEDRQKAFAEQAKAEIAKLPKDAPLNGTKNGNASPSTKPPVARPTKPVRTDTPNGTSSTPSAETADQRVLREMEATGRY